MWVSESVNDLRQRRRAIDQPVALVPTMGALHAGHVALLEHAKRLGGAVIASIFVNPTQFGPGEDFERYPRPLEDDLAVCEQAGADGVFAPQPDEVYLPNESTLNIDLPTLTGDLEGAHRPGHFQGVCLVVAKLFNMVQPDAAVFGRKDYQQLKVIEAMTAALAMPIAIVAHPTVREPDGLALSSRNAYLNDEQRGHALGLYKALSAARELIETEGENDPAAVESAMTQVMTAHHVEVDYAAVRHPHSLARLDCIEPNLTGGIAALVAGRVGDVRLIDNLTLGGGAS